MERWIRSLVDWIEIPSVTGSEGDYGDALERRLAAMGLAVERQELAPGRFNVLARAGEPDVVFCTHQDTVPPWFGSRTSAGAVHGRGACDAKGPAVAMLAAGERLLAAGEDRFGYLFTVGEETDSAGAALANARLAEAQPAAWRPRHVIVGEPTGNRFGAAGKGMFRGTLAARGVAGHSSQPTGPSAVHELVHCLHALLSSSWGEHPVLGPGSVNFGEIQGGVAANVVADRAQASILVRAVEPVEAVRGRIDRALGPCVALEPGVKAYPPVEFLVPGDPEVAAEPGIAVAFGTDAPHMPRFGKPLLFGPGSIQDAHTDHEKVLTRELEEAAVLYERTAAWLLAR